MTLRRSQSLGPSQVTGVNLDVAPFRDRPRARDDLDWRSAMREMSQQSAEESEGSDSEEEFDFLKIAGKKNQIRCETGTIGEKKEPRRPCGPSPKLRATPGGRLTLSKTLSAPKEKQGDVTFNGEDIDEEDDDVVEVRALCSMESSTSPVSDPEPDLPEANKTQSNPAIRSKGKLGFSLEKNEELWSSAIIKWPVRGDQMAVRSFVLQKARRGLESMRRRPSSAVTRSYQSSSHTSGALRNQAYSRTGFNSDMALMDCRTEVIEVLEDKKLYYQRVKSRFRVRVGREKKSKSGTGMLVAIEIRALSPVHCRLDFRRSALDREKTPYWEFVDWYRDFLRSFRARRPDAVARSVPTLREKDESLLLAAQVEPR